MPYSNKVHLAGSSQGEVCCQQWTHWEEQMPRKLNQIQSEVSNNIQSSCIKAAYIQHASVIGICDRETIWSHSTNNQFSRNTHFLQEKKIRTHLTQWLQLTRGLNLAILLTQTTVWTETALHRYVELQTPTNTVLNLQQLHLNWWKELQWDIQAQLSHNTKIYRLFQTQTFHLLFCSSLSENFQQ